MSVHKAKAVDPTKYSIGQPVVRREDLRFTTGRGRYVDDFRFEAQCHAQIIYSDRAHANIKRIDVSEALKVSGVIAVLLGKDCEDDGIGGIPPRFLPQDFGWGTAYRTLRPILAKGRVRHVGERIAVVIAETPAIAKDAGNLLEIEYEDLPAAVDLQSAAEPGAPLVHPEGGDSNRVWTMRFGKPELAAEAFASAAHIVKVDVAHPRIAAAPMEPRSAIGVYESGTDSYTLYSGTQAPHILRAEIAAHCLRIPEASLRVVSPDVGGGFGLKTTPFAEDVIVLWAARRLGRPVKWTGSRADNMASDDQGRGSVGSVELALDADGHIVGYKSRMLHDVGAYIVGAGTMPMVHTIKLVTSVYRVPTLDAESTLVFTNSPSTTPYRGAGRPEAVFAMEKALDKAARLLGLSRLEIRRRNLIRKHEFPYTTHTGFIYDSGEFIEILDRCAAAADWDNFETRRAESLQRGKIRGLGIAYYPHDTGNQNDRMEIRFDPSGGATIMSGTASTGMGHETVYAQMAGAWLGIPMDAIRVVTGDTYPVHYGRGSYASRSMTVGGSALKVAAENIISKAKIFAARLLEGDPSNIDFDDGILSLRGTNKSVSIQDVAKASFRPNMPIDQGIGLEAVGTFQVTQSSFPNGCHISEIEIDRETGQAEVVRYTVVDDFGRIMNSMLVLGQVQGGIAQGFGAVFQEKMVYDTDSGQLKSGSFVDYNLPRAAAMFDMDVSFHEVPCVTNPAGVKGAGEGGTVGSTSCLYNAVIDALQGYDTGNLHMPLTPSKVWEVLWSHSGT